MTHFRSRFALLGFLLGLMVVGVACGPGPEATTITLATATPAPTETATTPVNTNTATATPSPTVAPSDTPAPSPTATETPRPTETPTEAPASDSDSTPAPTDTPTPSPTATETPLPTATPAPTLSPQEVAGREWTAGLTVPSGFEARYLGSVERPTSLSYGPQGELFVAQQDGSIYRITASGQAQVYASGFTLPIGMAFKPGTNQMFVASRSENHDAGYLSLVQPDGSVQRVISDLPCCYTPIYHQPNSLVIGPDGFLYMSIGARSDHGEKSAEEFAEPGELHPLEGGILRIDPTTFAVEKYASGLRNPYDLAFDANGQLYANDNGQDYGPGDELNRIEAGKHYGWPYEPCQICFPPPPDLLWEAPLITLPDHSAPTGLMAYTASQFPAEYQNSLLMAMFTGVEGGQSIVRVDPATATWEPFITGFLAPIDVVQAPDGSITVADWVAGHIAQVRYVN